LAEKKAILDRMATAARLVQLAHLVPRHRARLRRAAERPYGVHGLVVDDIVLELSLQRLHNGTEEVVLQPPTLLYLLEGRVRGRAHVSGIVQEAVHLGAV
jgi:hypothetical protein